MLQFTHLLVEAKSKYSPNIKPYLKTHDILDSVDAFYKIGLNYNMTPPIKIKTKPAIFIMRRKQNIIYDPLHTKSKRHVSLIVNENLEQKFSNRNKDLQKIEPIFNDIMESLEKIGKPLENVNVNMLEASEEIESDYNIENKTDFSPRIEVKKESISKIENKKIEVKVLKNKEVANEKIKNSNTGNIDKSILDGDSNIIAANQEIEVQDKFDAVKLNIKEKQSGKIMAEIQQKESIKEAVKKMIQEKKESKTKKEISETEKKMFKEKIEKVNHQPQKISQFEKLDQSEKLFQAKRRFVEKEVNQQDSKKLSKVKESIRKIINQFREFEKDFTSDDQDISKPNPSSEDLEENAVSIDESAFSIEKVDSEVLINAKESLKGIIDQFKELRSELTSEEDDQFDEITANYMYRPISETLMHFSEALKKLAQRRRVKAETFEESSKKINKLKLLQKNST